MVLVDPVGDRACEVSSDGQKPNAKGSVVITSFDKVQLIKPYIQPNMYKAEAQIGD